MRSPALAPRTRVGGKGRRRVLLVTSLKWLSTTRLALALHDAGFAVEAVCPARHSLTCVSFVDRIHRLNPLAAQASLAAAIEAAAPDLIIPCDDRIAHQLHLLYARSDPDRPMGLQIRTLLTRSLAAPAAFPLLHTRAHIMALAEEEALRRPDTAATPDREALAAWLDSHALPAVLKTDGSWGGMGVAVVKDRAEAMKAFRRLNAPPSPVRALKRLMMNADAAPIRDCLARRRPAISIQAFVPGRLGNAAVACLDGKVLAAVYVQVERSDGPTGPATVVQVIEHPEMARAVAAMVARLGLSGLCGFDFVLDPETGAADLLEINPRATPTCHLVSADGRDLMSALMYGLDPNAGEPPPPRPAPGLVALFPQEMVRDPDSGFLESAHHDVPWQSVELVELGLDKVRGGGRKVNAAVRRFYSQQRA